MHYFKARLMSRKQLTVLAVILSVSGIGAFSMSFKLKQAINVPGIKIVSTVLSKPSIAVPKIELNTLNDLNISKLKSDGVKYLVFDKDNTLSITYSNTIHPSVDSFIKNAKYSFTPEAIAILSNSVGTEDDANFEGAKLTELEMGIPVIRHKLKKPACLNEVVDHFEKSTGNKVETKEICMIGDRLLTDVVFANRFGMVSVLVAPLNHYRDHPVAVVLSMEYVAKMDSGPITEKQLVDAEFSAAKLKEIGYGAEQLKLCGFDAKELKEAEFTAIQLRCAGFTPAEMRAGGYTINEVFDAGFKHSRLVEAGFTANEMREEMNLNLVELRAAGFKAGQLKAVGFLASELRAVGATAAEIKPYFTPGEILRAGYPKEKLKPLGVWPHDGQWQHYNNYWSCCFSLEKQSTCCAATQPTGTETSTRKYSF